MEEAAVFKNKPLVAPTAKLAQQAPLSVLEASRLLESARNDPLSYWEDIAEELFWYSGWNHTLEGELGNFRYFAGGLSNVSVNCVDRHLSQHANKVAIFYEREDGLREVWSYRQLSAEVNRFAAAMRAMGIAKGDRVAIYMSNIPEVFAVIQACYRIGAIYSVSFAGFSAEAVHDRLLDSQPRLVVVADGSLRRGKVVPLKETLDQALEGIGSVEKVVVVPRLEGSRVVDHPVPMTEGRDVFYADFVAGFGPEFPAEPIEANEPGFIIYTSGTTSKPKGLVHSGIGFLTGAYANVKWALNLQPDDVYWCTADVGWLTFPIFALVGGLAHGATLVAYEGAVDIPNPGRFYEVLGRYRVNKLFTAPTLLRMLRRAGDSYLEHTQDLELISLVGEPLDPETFYWTKDKLGGGQVFVNNTYGQTETGTAWASALVGLTPTKPGSCGHTLPGYVPEVVDEQGLPVGVGELGYLTLKEPFPSLARTIWNNPERYHQTYLSRFSGRYFTADAAAFDEDGQLWVTSRVDDVINVAGHRIGTMELEAALTNHPAVSEAAVVGLPDPIKGSVPLAFVILRAGQQKSSELETELSEQIAQTVGSYARPQRVIISSTFPRTRSGKIMRRLLRDLMVEGQVSGDVSALENPEAIENLRAELGSPTK
ncbi:MAG: acetate--CoA ligase [Thermaceae bacterium]|nr:acetate--CoA ligase [Thermaceae bacterium]